MDKILGLSIYDLVVILLKIQVIGIKESIIKLKDN